jgi:hypothetical protein
MAMCRTEHRHVQEETDLNNKKDSQDWKCAQTATGRQGSPCTCYRDHGPPCRQETKGTLGKCITTGSSNFEHVGLGEAAEGKTHLAIAIVVFLLVTRALQ